MNDRKFVENIAAAVANRGGRAFYVGGCVRDEIMGLPCDDLDVEVHGIAPGDLEQVLSEFGEVRKQGIAFGIYKIDHHDIDIAMPRTEKSTGRGHRDFETYVDPNLGYEKAARRRDFTMNSIMKDVLTGEYVDPCNGISDIKNRIIRHVDTESFIEDPLRVLRGAEFKARFNDLGFVVASETEDLMRCMDLSALSRERVHKQTVKALMLDKPSVYFNELREINQLSCWYPELQALIGCEQNSEYHPEGDVWIHTMNVVDYAAGFKNDVSNPEYFMFSALLHDTGKPLSAGINNRGCICHIGHDERGVDIAHAFISRLTSDKKLDKYVGNMVELHMKAHAIYDNKSRYSRTNAFFDKTINGRDMIYLAAADSCGRSDEYVKDFMSWMNDRLEYYEDRMKQDYVKGNDLLKLGFRSGPELAPILSDAKKLHLSGQDKKSVMKNIASVYKKQIPNYDKDHIASVIEEMSNDSEVEPS